MAIQWPDDSIFDPFSISEETYKVVAGHEIKAAIMVPKSLTPGSHPVIINIHGGFLMTAHSLFAPFVNRYIMELAQKHSAIIVSPDYRLLPTPNGVTDILEDLEDFWQWSRSTLPGLMERQAPGHTLDLSQLLLAGGSAGGYCATQLALSHPDEVSTLALIYPQLDTKDTWWNKGPGYTEPTVLRFPAEDIPSRDETLAWLEEKRETVTTKDDFERSPYCVASLQHGDYYYKVLDPKEKRDPKIYPLERIKAGSKLPKSLWIGHGDAETTVPLRHSQSFVDLVKEKLPSTEIKFDVVEGQDHAFDVDESTWASQKPQAMDFIVGRWLRQ